VDGVILHKKWIPRNHSTTPMKSTLKRSANSQQKRALTAGYLEK
jgi:hypothetical protein